MRIFLLSIFFLNTVLVYSQKATLGFNDYKTWTTVGDAKISNDGNSIAYFIQNKPFGSNTLYVVNERNQQKLQIPRVRSYPCEFTQNSKYLLFADEEDSVGIVSFNEHRIRYISNVYSCKLFENEYSTFLIYQPKESSRLVILNLESKQEIIIDSVSNYLLGGQNVIIQKHYGDLNSGSELLIISPVKGTILSFWKGDQVKEIVLSADGSRLAIITKCDSSNGNERCLRVYKNDHTNPAELLAFNMTKQFPEFAFDDIVGFSKDSKRIFLSAKEHKSFALNPSFSSVDLWSYTDTKIQSMQLKELVPKKYIAGINIETREVFKIQKINEKISRSGDQIGDNILLIKQDIDVDNAEKKWNAATNYQYWLVSSVDGSRKYLYGFDNLSGGFLSPQEKFIVFFKDEDQAFYSYDIKMGITKKITIGVKTTWSSAYQDDAPNAMILPRNNGVAGWIKNDSALLLYDRYDIWQVDPTGNLAPICITNGYGSKHKIVFSLAQNDELKEVIANEGSIILSAFSLINKNNGFFKVQIGNVANPELLTMGHYVYHIPQNPYLSIGTFNPVKAKNSNRYIVKRMSSIESANYFLTTDFKNFKPISDNYPEKSFNWITTQLINWKTLDGTFSQGILYKPENFNPDKIYPVIFYIYERFSDRLNVYVEPTLSQGHLSIHKLVNMGYIVFSPDIHYRLGRIGESVMNSVISSAKYLSQFSWINYKKMGIVGHSHGCYEVSHVITHSNLFAAACIANGATDFLSFSGSLSPAGFAFNEYTVNSQPRMGNTLWEKPDLYLQNSALLNAHKTTAPVLMLFNKNDGSSFLQGVQFFTGLRRLGKRVWMLQYDKSGHTLHTEEDQLDYTLRQQQFFDHYLKDSAAPRWMMYGIPAKDKGIVNGLELIRERDTNTGKWKTPQVGGVLKDEERKKVNILRNRKPITIKLN